MAVGVRGVNGKLRRYLDSLGLGPAALAPALFGGAMAGLYVTVASLSQRSFPLRRLPSRGATGGKVRRTGQPTGWRRQAVNTVLGDEQSHEAFQVAGAGRGPERGDEATV